MVLFLIMGASSSSTRNGEIKNLNDEVGFDDFQIMRAIGKGAFGKVCIVQKRDTRYMYAMKYMSKASCVEKDAVRNVFREFEILKGLEHPFLVNMWFTFQDAEDMFMVVDLLLGGDLRYHMQHEQRFCEHTLRVYLAEMALALDYLRANNVLHRDIKPDNILLDDKGHLHLTDFNIATVLHEGQLATSLSGTKPYMAPELFLCALDQVPGYSFAVDWWSLGVTVYEIVRFKRPYDIHSGSNAAEVRELLEQTALRLPSSCSENLAALLTQLLQLNPSRRLCSLKEMCQTPFFQDWNFDDVMAKKISPKFIPSTAQLNCDPTYELEEMIIESNPLHKKKKRLAKSSTKRSNKDPLDPLQLSLDNISLEFCPFNREQELRRLAEPKASDVASTPVDGARPLPSAANSKAAAS